MVYFNYQNMKLTNLNSELMVKEQDVYKKLSRFKKNAKFSKNFKKNKGTSVDLYSIQNEQIQLQYVLKTCKNCDTWADYLNEYHVAKYGLNGLRPYLENFVYIYDFEEETNYHEVQYIRIYEEYVSNKTFQEFLSELLYFSDSATEILKLILQVVLSLEIAQQKCHFCHYDLHLKNIMIAKILTKNLSYHLFNENCKIKEVSSLCKIIDYGISSIAVKPDTETKTNTSLPENDTKKSQSFSTKTEPIQEHVIGTNNYKQFGIYPFMLPAIDLIRFLFSIYVLVKKTVSRNTIKNKIETFLLFIFKNFFKLNVEFASLKNIQNILQNFCNLSFTLQVFLNPYDLLIFLKDNEETCCSILDISEFPWLWENIPVNTFGMMKNEVYDFDVALKKNYNEMERTLSIMMLENSLLPVQFENFETKFYWYLFGYDTWYNEVFESQMQNISIDYSPFWEKNGFQRMTSLYRKFWTIKLYLQNYKQEDDLNRFTNYIYKNNISLFFQNKL